MLIKFGKEADWTSRKWKRADLEVYENEELFIGLFSLFSDNRLATLKKLALLAHTFHVIVLNVSSRRKQQVVGNECRPRELLPQNCSDEQLDGVGVGQDKDMSIDGISFLLKMLLESSTGVNTDILRT